MVSQNDASAPAAQPMSEQPTWRRVEVTPRTGKCLNRAPTKRRLLAPAEQSGYSIVRVDKSHEPAWCEVGRRPVWRGNGIGTSQAEVPLPPSLSEGERLSVREATLDLNGGKGSQSRPRETILAEPDVDRPPFFLERTRQWDQRHFAAREIEREQSAAIQEGPRQCRVVALK